MTEENQVNHGVDVEKLEEANGVFENLIAGVEGRRLMG